MQCNDCRDMIQTYFPRHTHDTTSVNLVLAFNVGLMLVYYLQSRSELVLKPLVITALMLVLFDCVLHMTTTCQVNPNHDDDDDNSNNNTNTTINTTTNTNNTTNNTTVQSWRIISKRVVLSGLVTLFVWQDLEIPLGFKWISMGCTFYVAGLDILSRRHYTVDVLLTGVLLYLGFKVAVKYYGNTKSTITK